jgi:hypothetical protein
MVTFDTDTKANVQAPLSDTRSGDNWVEGTRADSIRVQDNPHNGCVLTITEQGDKLGVLAEGWLSLPGRPDQQWSKFIPAQ